MSDEKSTEPRKDSVLLNHLCEHPGCSKWGSFGFAIGKAAPNWFCLEHRHETWPPGRQQ